MEDDIFVSEAELLELENDFEEDTYCICQSLDSENMICCEDSDCKIKVLPS